MAVNNSADGQGFSNISASTSPFKLSGGRYMVVVHATWGGGNVTLQVLALDGVTWITSPIAQFTADAASVSDLGPGQYRFAVTTATGIYASIDSTGSP
jgi:hypothetical protein